MISFLKLIYVCSGRWTTLKWRSKLTMKYLISRRIVPLFINDFHRMNEVQVPNFVDTLESFTDILHLSILLIEVRFRARIPKSANESIPQITFIRYKNYRTFDLWFVHLVSYFYFRNFCNFVLLNFISFLFSFM